MLLTRSLTIQRFVSESRNHFHRCCPTQECRLWQCDALEDKDLSLQRKQGLGPTEVLLYNLTFGGQLPWDLDLEEYWWTETRICINEGVPYFLGLLTVLFPAPVGPMTLNARDGKRAVKRHRQRINSQDYNVLRTDSFPDSSSNAHALPAFNVEHWNIDGYKDITTSRRRWLLYFKFDESTGSSESMAWEEFDVIALLCCSVRKLQPKWPLLSLKTCAHCI